MDVYWSLLSFPQLKQITNFSVFFNLVPISRHSLYRGGYRILQSRGGVCVWGGGGGWWPRNCYLLERGTSTTRACTTFYPSLRLGVPHPSSVPGFAPDFVAFAQGLKSLYWGENHISERRSSSHLKELNLQSTAGPLLLLRSKIVVIQLGVFVKVRFPISTHLVNGTHAGYGADVVGDGDECRFGQVRPTHVISTFLANHVAKTKKKPQKKNNR